MRSVRVAKEPTISHEVNHGSKEAEAEADRETGSKVDAKHKKEIHRNAKQGVDPDVVAGSVFAILRGAATWEGISGGKSTVQSVGQLTKHKDAEGRSH